MSENAERAAFQDYILCLFGFENVKRAYYLSRLPSGRYAKDKVQWAWKAWLESAKGGRWRDVTYSGSETNETQNMSHNLGLTETRPMICDIDRVWSLLDMAAGLMAPGKAYDLVREARDLLPAHPEISRLNEQVRG